MIENSKVQNAVAAAQTAMKARLAELGFDPVRHEALFKHIVNNAAEEFSTYLALDRLQPIEQKAAAGVADIAFLTPQLASQIGDAYREYYIGDVCRKYCSDFDKAVDELLSKAGINCELFEELLEGAVAPLGAQALMGALVERDRKR